MHDPPPRRNQPALAPACEVVRQVIARAVRGIASRLGRSDGADVELGSVLCLPHLASLLQHLPDRVGTHLLHRQAVILDRLADDVQRFALKQDGARRYLASREELAAGRRGLRALLGDPNAVAGPQPREAAGTALQFARESG